MKGNKLIKRIKALQRIVGHDIEIGFQGSAGYRDIYLQPRFVSRNGVEIPLAAILLDGNNYYPCDVFMRIALANRIDILGNSRCNITDDERIFMSNTPPVQNEREQTN